MRQAAWRSVLLAAWLLPALGVGGKIAPARAELISVAAGAPLTVHGIPLPRNAEPFLAANLTVENLRALAPNAGELGTSGWVRAVVYNVQEVVRPDEAAAFYRDTMGAAFLPRGRAAGAAGKPADDDSTRVLQLERPPRTLAVRSEAASGPTRVTVAMFQGAAAPAVVLHAIDALRTGRSGPKLKDSPELLNPDPWEFDSKVEGARLDILKQNLTRSTAPEPVIDVGRSLLNQAQMLHQQIYQVSRRVPAQEVLIACSQEAQRQDWQLLMVEAVTPDSMTALYVQPRNRGVVWWRAGRATKNISPLGGVAPLLTAATEINRLEVSGRIDVQALFRPSQARPAPQKAPYIAPRPRRTAPAPPAGPFSSQRRN